MAEQTLKNYFGDKLRYSFMQKSQDAVVDKFKLRDLTVEAFERKMPPYEKLYEIGQRCGVTSVVVEAILKEVGYA